MLFGQSFLQQIPFLVAAFIPALTFHEWGHARMAKVFGDTTAERAGRLTLNPLAHLDLFGSLAILIIGFGWAKPVPIDPRQMKGRWAEFWVASAGVMMNLCLAIFFGMLMRFGLPSYLPAPYDAYVYKILQISVFLNLALLFFNLIPIGPLDGKTVLSQLLPLRQSIQFDMWNARYGSTVLLILIASEFIFHFGPLQFLVLYPTQFVFNLLV